MVRNIIFYIKRDDICMSGTDEKYVRREVSVDRHRTSVFREKGAACDSRINMEVFGYV